MAVAAAIRSDIHLVRDEDPREDEDEKSRDTEDGLFMPLLDNANWLKVALLLKGIPEEDTPTLLVHASVDPE